jgi:tape measure domain-containing protein
VSVVANVAINLDATGVSSQLKAIHAASLNAANGITQFADRVKAAKAATEAAQGGFAKASTVQGVFAAKVKNTQAAITAQIAALKRVQSTVQLGGALYQKAGAQIQQYQAVLDSVNTPAEETVGLFGKLRQAAGSLVGQLLAVTTAVTAVQKSLSVAFKRGVAEQRLKNLTSSTGEYEAALAAAKSAADKFGMSQTDATQAFAEAYGRLKSLGFGLKEVNEVYVGFNNAARAAGVSVEDSNGAFVQLAQGMSAGVLNGENLVTILERMPQLGKLLADSMGVSAGEIKKLGSEGKITTDVIYKALKQSADAAGDLNGKLTEQQKAFNSLGRATDSLLNSIGKLFEPGVIAGAKALAAAAEEIGTFFSMLASKLFPEVKESAEELSSVFKKTDDTVLSLKNAFKGFLQTAAFIGTLALSLNAVAIGTAAVVAVTKAWAIATAAVGAAKAFIMGLLGNLPALALGFFAATAAAVALGAGLDKVGVEMDEFKRQQAEAEAKAKGTVDNYSSMPPKIKAAADANKGLIASTNQVLQNLNGQKIAIGAQIASLERGASVTSARYGAEKAINDLQGQQLERAYGLQTTAQGRLNIAVRIFNNAVNAAKIEYKQALENIALEQRKTELQVQLAQLKLKEIEAEGQLQILKSKDAAEAAEKKRQLDKALGAQMEVVTAIEEQAEANKQIGKYQKNSG